MGLATRQTRLIDRLPEVRGRMTPFARLAQTTWFRVGGPAEVMFRPADITDLIGFLVKTPEDVPITVIGVGSNLLVRDGGVPGVVIRLGGAFAEIKVEGDRVRAGAGALDAGVAEAAARAGVARLEFLTGIPGTLGGAIRMNAGAYGSEIAAILDKVTLVDRRGELREEPAAALGLGYRQSAIGEDEIVLAATLVGTAGDPEAILERMAEIRAERAESQPIRARSSGSAFGNPPGMKAWQLIDDAGCRGLSLGGAQVSEKHCNFLINTGDATAHDIEELGETVRKRVFDRAGIWLDWEIRRIGVDTDHAFAVKASPGRDA